MKLRLCYLTIGAPFEPSWNFLSDSFNGSAGRLPAHGDTVYRTRRRGAAPRFAYFAPVKLFDVCYTDYVPSTSHAPVKEGAGDEGDLHRLVTPGKGGEWGVS